MRISELLLRNLNAKHWNRRVWEIGYRGPLLPQIKAKRNPPMPVTDNAIIELREQFNREYAVMKCLATPYFTKDQEASFIGVHGTLEQKREERQLKLEQVRMPGEPKYVNIRKEVTKRRANVGNLLHSHRTVEDSLQGLILRRRWD